jgi:hypothetical protein
MQINQKLCLLLVYTTLMMLLSGCATSGKSDVDRRAEIRTMASDTLTRLYAEQPAARAAIKRAAGYGVFSNFGLKILVAGGGNGIGLVRCSQSNTADGGDYDATSRSDSAKHASAGTTSVTGQCTAANASTTIALECAACLFAIHTAATLYQEKNDPNRGRYCTCGRHHRNNCRRVGFERRRC